jgi:hypothetical protein
MSDNQYSNSEDEAAAAQDRINRIIGGGAQQQSDNSGYSEQLGESDALNRARSAGRDIGSNRDQSYDNRRPRRSGGASQAIVVIGGLVVFGILVVGVLFLATPLLRGDSAGFSIPFLATATPTYTPTPLATATPTITPTATKSPPQNLEIPSLTCIFQSGIGCSDYCKNPANAQECDGAKAKLERENIKFDLWLQCVAPGPGPNTGDANTCLGTAWLASNP